MANTDNISSIILFSMDEQNYGDSLAYCSVDKSRNGNCKITGTVARAARKDDEGNIVEKAYAEKVDYVCVKIVPEAIWDEIRGKDIADFALIVRPVKDKTFVYDYDKMGRVREAGNDMTKAIKNDDGTLEINWDHPMWYAIKLADGTWFHAGNDWPDYEKHDNDSQQTSQSTKDDE